MSTDIIAGRNPVIEALKSGTTLNKIILAKNTERHSTVAAILHLAQEKGVPVEYVERSAIDRLSATPANQGVIAYAAAREYIDLPDLLSLTGDRNETPLYVVLDGIEDPHNMGAIIRTAEATGVHGVIIRSRRAVGLTAAVFKASAGAVEYVAVARVPNIAQALDTLKKNNVWVVGIDQTGEVDYTRVDYTPPTVLVVGGEGKGLTPLVKSKCDFVVSIPMKGKITSLNASVATAVVLYEVLRQRIKS